MKDMATRCIESFNRDGVNIGDLNAWARVNKSMPLMTHPYPYPFNQRTRQAWEEGFLRGLQSQGGSIYMECAFDYREAFQDGYVEGFRVREALAAAEEVEP